ncbi:hypothetical protein L6164_010317 [Bauhinia variegata]|uniref:Uncharacterized protein n=1 Tax=Bauhinia variegata TaxID=167791 RepID=A0ACB9PNW5_BAUVA|nr:hypothetical protein L6164_010317 [Bauhinia variegata]
MGVSSEPLLVSLSLKDLAGENNNNSYGSLWSKVLAANSKKQKIVSKKSAYISCRPRRILMTRRAGLVEGSRRRRRRSCGIERRVRTLKRLLPSSESVGLDGLFRETADYILSLQMRMRVMQIVVEVLTGSDDI